MQTGALLRAAHGHEALPAGQVLHGAFRRAGRPSATPVASTREPGWPSTCAMPSSGLSWRPRTRRCLGVLDVLWKLRSRTTAVSPTLGDDIWLPTLPAFWRTSDCCPHGETPLAVKVEADDPLPASVRHRYFSILCRAPTLYFCGGVWRGREESSYPKRPSPRHQMAILSPSRHGRG